MSPVAVAVFVALCLLPARAAGQDTPRAPVWGYTVLSPHFDVIAYTEIQSLCETFRARELDRPSHGATWTACRRARVSPTPALWRADYWTFSGPDPGVTIGATRQTLCEAMRELVEVHWASHAREMPDAPPARERCAPVSLRFFE